MVLLYFLNYIMADALNSSFASLDELEISEIEQLATLPNVDNFTSCKCRGRYCCLRERGRNFCPCKSMNKYCSSACQCHKEDFGRCLNSRNLYESDSEESDRETVSFAVCIIMKLKTT